jgi:phosphatidylserine decarboxylase
VLVGATNVGRISISFEKRVSANNLKRILSFPKPAPVQFDYPEKISIARGERLGTFHLGSSVVVLAPKGMLGDSAVADGKAVQYGQHMAKFSV